MLRCALHDNDPNTQHSIPNTQSPNTHYLIMKSTKTFLRPLLLSLGLTTGLLGCDNRDPGPAPAPTGSGQYALVLNEGNFLGGTGAVSRFDKTTQAVVPDLFGAANGGAALGSVVQSMTVVGQRGYVVVNNSNKIEVVSLPDFKSITTINGLSQPRHLTLSVANPGRAYVTEWLGGPYPAPYLPGRVSILDLTTNKILQALPTGTNPERPVLLGGRLYVPNSGTASLSVFDDATGAALPSIALPSEASGGLVADASGNLWVLCGSDYVSRPATLVRLNPLQINQQTQLPLPSAGGGGGLLRISPNGQQLYYNHDEAEYRMNVTDPALPPKFFLKRDFYGFDIDPATGLLYATDALNYSSPGRLIRYQPDGTKLDSATVLVSPNGVVFF